jgi:hypothetical protein
MAAGTHDEICCRSGCIRQDTRCKDSTIGSLWEVVAAYFHLGPCILAPTVFEFSYASASCWEMVRSASSDEGKRAQDLGFIVFSEHLGHLCRIQVTIIIEAIGNAEWLVDTDLGGQGDRVSHGIIQGG